MIVIIIVFFSDAYTVEQTGYSAGGEVAINVLDDHGGDGDNDGDNDGDHDGDHDHDARCLQVVA